MKLALTASWIVEVLASILAAISLYASGWFFTLIWADIRGPHLSAGSGGMPGNAAAGVGIAIGLGIGIVAALLALALGTAALPSDKITTVWKFGRLVQKASLVGLVSPLAWIVLGLLFG